MISVDSTVVDHKHRLTIHKALWHSIKISVHTTPTLYFLDVFSCDVKKSGESLESPSNPDKQNRRPENNTNMSARTAMVKATTATFEAPQKNSLVINKVTLLLITYDPK